MHSIFDSPQTVARFGESGYRPQASSASRRSMRGREIGTGSGSRTRLAGTGKTSTTSRYVRFTRTRCTHSLTHSPTHPLTHALAHHSLTHSTWKLPDNGGTCDFTCVSSPFACVVRYDHHRVTGPMPHPTLHCSQQGNPGRPSSVFSGRV